MHRPDCPYSHSAAAERPWCKYFDQAGGCKFGSRCLFRHPKPVAGDENAAQQAAEDSVRDAATSAEMQEAVQRGLQHLDDQCHSVRSTGVFTGMMGANALEPFDYLNLTSLWTLGDGDLSWSRMIAAKAAAHEAGSRALRPSGLVATTLLSFDELKRAHPSWRVLRRRRPGTALPSSTASTRPRCTRASTPVDAQVGGTRCRWAAAHRMLLLPAA